MSSGQFQPQFLNPYTSATPGQPEEPAESIKQEEEDEKTRKGCWYRCCPLCTVLYYKPYFNVTSKEVRAKFCLSLIPFYNKFNEVCQQKPDFYGPFWICTTVVLFLGIASEFNEYLEFLSSSDSSQTYQYDVYKIPTAAALIYGGGIILPLILGLMMKCLGSKVSINMVLTGYGYSFSIFLPVTLLCAIPFTVAQIIFLVYAFVTSTGFLVAIYWEYVRKQETWKKVMVISFVVGFQAVILILYKLFFFKYVI